MNRAASPASTAARAAVHAVDTQSRNRWTGLRAIPSRTRSAAAGQPAVTACPGPRPPRAPLGRGAGRGVGRRRPAGQRECATATSAGSTQARGRPRHWRAPTQPSAGTASANPWASQRACRGEPRDRRHHQPGSEPDLEGDERGGPVEQVAEAGRDDGRHDRRDEQETRFRARTTPSNAGLTVYGQGSIGRTLAWLYGPQPLPACSSATTGPNGGRCQGKIARRPLPCRPGDLPRYLRGVESVDAIDASLAPSRFQLCNELKIIGASDSSPGRPT